MRGHLGLPATGELPADDGARRMPGMRIRADRPSLRAGDRDVRVVMAMTSPRVVVFADLLSADECAELIALARARLERSETVQTETGGSEVNAARTSEGMFFAPAEFPVCARLEERIAALVDWPVENGEGLQILRYRPGAQYRPHYDYFDPAERGTPKILERGGQRVALDRLLSQHARSGRGDGLPGRRPRSRTGAGQRSLLQLRPAAPLDADAARRRRGRCRREVGRDQVAARGQVRVMRGGRAGVNRVRHPGVVSPSACSQRNHHKGIS